jgi:hypothetical protein
VLAEEEDVPLPDDIQRHGVGNDPLDVAAAVELAAGLPDRDRLAGLPDAFVWLEDLQHTDVAVRPRRTIR